jgi:hypothetical protein
LLLSADLARRVNLVRSTICGPPHYFGNISRWAMQLLKVEVVAPASIALNATADTSYESCGDLSLADRTVEMMARRTPRILRGMARLAQATGRSPGATGVSALGART